MARDYREDEWEEGVVAPYQVKLFPVDGCPSRGRDGTSELDGMLIFAPVDEDDVIRAPGGGGGDGESMAGVESAP